MVLGWSGRYRWRSFVLSGVTRDVEGGRLGSCCVCPIKERVTKVELELFVCLRWSWLAYASLVVCTCNDAMMASGTGDVTVCTQEAVRVHATTTKTGWVTYYYIDSVVSCYTGKPTCTPRVSVHHEPSGIIDCSACSVSPRLLAHPPAPPATDV